MTLLLKSSQEREIKGIKLKYLNRYFVRNWNMHLTRSKPRVNSIFERVLRDG